jgi:hypothetical protein
MIGMLHPNSSGWRQPSEALTPLTGGVFFVSMATRRLNDRADRPRQHARARRAVALCLVLDVTARRCSNRCSDDVVVPTSGPRMVCTGCGIVGANARPNWKEQSPREMLTGVQWRN